MANNKKSAANAKSTTTKKNKKALKKKRWGLRIAAILLSWVILIGSVVFFEPQINQMLGFVDSEGNTLASDKPIDLVLAGRGSSALTIHYIDVGQGDATLIELPGGTDQRPRLMLIDGAPNKSEAKLLEYIDSLFPALRTQSDYFLEYVILTHTDEDHCGGMDGAINAYGAKYIYRPNVRSTYKDFLDPALSLSGKNALVGEAKSGKGEKSTLAYMRFVDAAYNSAVAGSEVIVSVNPLTATDQMQKYINVFDGNNDGDYTDDEDCLIKFYSPLSDYYKDGNDYSPILTIDYMGRRALFSGDAEKTAEAEFVQQYSKAQFGKAADIIKLGHHGSRTSSSQAYLNVVAATNKSATFAIISCGVGNSYGHPHPEVLERLSEMGFSQNNILRTDLSSHIVFSVSQSGEMAFGTGLKREIVQDPMRWAYVAAAIGIFITLLLVGIDYKKLLKQVDKATKK